MIISVKDLSKNFKQGEHVVSAVKGVSFELQEGDSLALTGPSGSGKTTIMSLLAGLDSPTGGELQVTGVNLKDLSEKELAQFRAQKIGVVFQQFHLMPHLTALENVCLPLEINKFQNVKTQAEAILTEVGLTERLHHLPNQLSGGEKQRVAIARALVTKPQVILADEPSGNLDFKTGEKVMSLLFNLVKAHGMSLVLVTHNRDLAKRCDAQIYLQSGLIKGEVL